MKTPDNILNLTQQSWLDTAKQLQRLQQAVDHILFSLGLTKQLSYTLYLERNNLNFKTSAAICTRLRQIAPELMDALNQQAWQLQAITFTVQKNNLNSLGSMFDPKWVNPNLLRYGKRQLPSTEQAAKIALFTTQQTKNLAGKSQTKKVIKTNSKSFKI